MAAPRAAAVLAGQAPVFDVGADIHDSAADRLLAHCASSPQVAALRPLALDEFAAAVARARVSSPGPHGLPYSVWLAADDPGVRILHRAYLALLQGISPPVEVKRSWALYIPKEFEYPVPGAPRRLHQARVRPMTLSNTAH